MLNAKGGWLSSRFLRLSRVTMLVLFLILVINPIFSEAANTDKYNTKTNLKQLTTRVQKGNEWRLIGDVKGVPAYVSTSKGTQRTTLRGRVEFKARPTRKGLDLELSKLELAGKSVTTGKGSSGVISVKLSPKSVESSFYPRSNKVTSTFALSLHYPTIDKTMGFRATGKAQEPDNYVSYVETMQGSLEGKFTGSLEPHRMNKVSFDGDMELKLTKQIVGDIRQIRIRQLRFVLIWVEYRFTVQNYLCIQPVFIGRGPGDSSATGESFNVLMNNSKDIWKKCCVFFHVREPVYINDSSYKELDPSDGEDRGSSPDEATDLMAEYNDPDCIEVYVARNWGGRGWDGGGATWSSGQAAAKIVTVDEQLDVPCSGRRSCTSCGPLNQNHLAHELGHVLNLLHPGDSRSGMTAGSSRSVLVPSGWCADNPAAQSVHNCDQASNPLMYLSSHFGSCSYNCEIS